MGTVEPAGSGAPALSNQKHPLTHTAYLITILIKGFFGLLEFVGGVVIATFGPQQLNTLVLQWTNPELYEASQNELLVLLREATSALAHSKGHFVIFYLLVHGTLKMAITAVLLRGHGAWIFPFASVILLGFIGLFAYDLSNSWSDWVLGLALFDTFTLALVLNEWRNWKSD